MIKFVYTENPDIDLQVMDGSIESVVFNKSLNKLTLMGKVDFFFTGEPEDLTQYWKNVEASEQQIYSLVDGLNYNKTYADQTFIRKPDILYQTDGTTGLLGLNKSTVSNTDWQLTDMDFSPYSYLKCFFKVADYEQTGNYLTPAVIVHLPLDDASKALFVNGIGGRGKTPCSMYMAGAATSNPNDTNVQFHVIVAVDESKTKFMVVSQHSIYGTVKGDRNNDGRYLYKIEGHYD